MSFGCALYRTGLTCMLRRVRWIAIWRLVLVEHELRAHGVSASEPVCMLVMHTNLEERVRRAVARNVRSGGVRIGAEHGFEEVTIVNLVGESIVLPFKPTRGLEILDAKPLDGCGEVLAVARRAMTRFLRRSQVAWKLMHDMLKQLLVGKHSGLCPALRFIPNVVKSHTLPRRPVEALQHLKPDLHDFEYESDWCASPLGRTDDV